LRQRGAFLIAAGVFMLVLLGFVGLAIDLSRMALIRAELQGAADACVLAAVSQLNGAPDGPMRAEVAGQFLGGTKNRHSFQSVAADPAQVQVTFSTTLNGLYRASTGGALASSRYARCAVTAPDVRASFMGLFDRAGSDLVATATATTMPSQSVCSIPMGMCEGSGSDSRHFGHTVGDRIVLGATQSSGYFTWVNVMGTQTTGGLQPYVEALLGYGVCDVLTPASRCIGIKTGVISSLDAAWNSRFGVYKQGGTALDPATAIPDLTGYGYRPPPVGGAAGDYQSVRMPAREPFQGSIASYHTPAGVHVQWGAPSRRLVSMPVVQCSSSTCGTGAKPILGWACALMLSPKSPSQDAEIEYRGRADDPASGCVSAGAPGGGDAIGPLVPVLVQ
jgi:Flp pilus assembly protein TadG